MNAHLQPWHVMAFEALASGRSEAFNLVPCFVGDEPTVAIAFMQQVTGGYEVTPLFVAFTPAMELYYPGEESGGGSGGGGPRRDGIAGQFEASKAMLSPG